jgi:hypothetical protein
MVDSLNCNFFQKNKLHGKGYGILLEREVLSILFEEFAVDLIGPWKVQFCGKLTSLKYNSERHCD